MAFNDRLKELRLRHNLSQENLSKKLNIATRTYIYYEKGHKYPSVELLTQMAKYFKVSISFLMDEQGESIVNAQIQDGKLGNFKAKQLVEEISIMFTGGELSETEKDSVMEAVQEAYWAAKKQTK